MDNVVQVAGVVGNVFTSNTIVDGQKIKVKIVDTNLFEHTSPEITLTVAPLPQTGSIYHIANTVF